MGFADAPDFTRDRLCAAGCDLGADGWVRFPRALVEDAIAATELALLLPGQRPGRDVELEGARVYFSTGYVSVRVGNPVGKTVRHMQASDVYDFACIVDQMENIHVFHRCGTPDSPARTGDNGGFPREVKSQRLHCAPFSCTSGPVRVSYQSSRG